MSTHKQDVVIHGKYRIMFGGRKEFTICYNESKPISHTFWQSTNPVMNKLPIFLTQLSFLIAITRVLMIILKPLRQPRFLSELLVCINSRIGYDLLFCN